MLLHSGGKAGQGGKIAGYLPVCPAAAVITKGQVGRWCIRLALMGLFGKGKVTKYSRGTGRPMIQRPGIPRGRAARPGTVLAAAALAAALSLAAPSVAGAAGPVGPASAAVVAGLATPSLSCPTTRTG